MHNNNYLSNYSSALYGNSLSSFKSNLEALQNVINDGIKKLDVNLSEDLFNVWLNYSQQIVNLIFENRANVYINYLNFCQTITASNLPPHEKMSQTIRYLIDLMRFV